MRFVYFAFGPILFIFSLFMLKRGIRTARSGLRQTAFVLMFMAAIKIFLADVQVLKKEILCAMDEELRAAACSTGGMMLLQISAIVLLLLSCFGIFQLYRRYYIVRRPTNLTPHEVNLRFWANVSFCSILAMVVWQLAPWVGYLTIGRIPEIFMKMPWQVLAMVNLGLLLFGFWRAESCSWNYDVSKKNKMSYMNETWNPRDTLWTGVFIYLITLALSYAAHDALAHGMIQNAE